MSLPWHCRLCPTQPHREDPRQCSSARERARRRPALQGEEEAPGESAANTDRGHSLGPEPPDAGVRRRVGAPAGVPSTPATTYKVGAHTGSFVVTKFVVTKTILSDGPVPVATILLVGPNFVTGRTVSHASFG